MSKTGMTPADTTWRSNAAAKLEAPVVLTPDQIQQIAAGARVSDTGDLTKPRMGFWPRPPSKPTLPIDDAM